MGDRCTSPWTPSPRALVWVSAAISTLTLAHDATAMPAAQTGRAPTAAPAVAAAAGQEASASPDGVGLPEPAEAGMIAVFAATPPVIDGVLDDEVWRLGQPTTDFKQRNPVDGGTPTEASEVRVAYDANNLYFGLMLYRSS